MVICVRKSRERELHVREVCNVHYTYGKTVEGTVYRENKSDINVRVKEVKYGSEVGKK